MSRKPSSLPRPGSPQSGHLPSLLGRRGRERLLLKRRAQHTVSTETACAGAVPSLPVSSLRALSVGTSFLQVQGIKAPPCGPDTIQAHLVFSPDLGRDSRMNLII